MDKADTVIAERCRRQWSVAARWQLRDDGRASDRSPGGHSTSGGHARRGLPPRRRAIAQSIPDDRLDRELERRLLALVVRAGLPSPVLHHEVVLPAGRTARLDIAWPSDMVAVEGEGRRWHAKRRERSMARRRAIQAVGWTIHPYGWTEVVERTASVSAEIKALAPCLVRSAASRVA